MIEAYCTGMAQPAKSTMRPPWEQCQSYRGVRKSRASMANPHGRQLQREGYSSSRTDAAQWGLSGATLEKLFELLWREAGVLAMAPMVYAWTGLCRGITRRVMPSDITTCLPCLIIRYPIFSNARTACSELMSGIFGILHRYLFLGNVED